MAEEAGGRINLKPRKQAHQGRRVVTIAKAVSATLGADFFQSMVKHLAQAFQADFAFIAELTGTPANRIRSVAAYCGPSELSEFEQELTGTASAQVLEDGSFARSKHLTQLFPLDQVMESTEAEGFVGYRLCDSGSQAMGLIAVAFRKPSVNVPLVRSVIEAFVPRAAAELERKRLEDRRREDDQRHAAFITTNPDAMWRIELERPVPLNLPEEEQIDCFYRFGYLAECNKAFATLMGREHPEDLLGMPFAEIAARMNPSGARDELRIAIRAGFRAATVETSPRDNAGRQTYRLRSQFGIIEQGKLHRIWGTTRDISDLRRTELSLSASERRFREVMQGIQIPVVILDAQGALTFANDCFLGLAGRPWEELNVSPWLAGVVPADEVDSWKKALRRDDGRRAPAVHFEGRLLGRKGPPRLIAWDTIALYHPNDEPAGLVALGWDMTRQRALERQIREAENLESIGRLAAGVAHDFNNLLMVVMGHAGHLLSDTSESDPQHESLRAIELAASQCSQLSQQLLAFARRQNLKPALVSLDDLITSGERIIRSLVTRNVQLEINLGSPTGVVFADPTQLQRVIANLVTNARDAMPQGGTVILSTSNVTIEAEDANYPGLTPGPYVRMAISDSGVGLTDDVRAHMFEPFFTTKEPDKGTGLGLSTVHGIVAQSGGHIAVRSELGKGTTFEILLPEQV